jgi:hypothetical protein
MNTMRRSIKSAHPSSSCHDCRPENLKLNKRNPLHDVAVLSKGLYRTANSTITLNEKYLFHQRNLIDRINDNHFRE